MDNIRYLNIILYTSTILLLYYDLPVAQNEILIHLGDTTGRTVRVTVTNDTDITYIYIFILLY